MKTFFVILSVFIAKSAAKVSLSDLTTICDPKSPNLNDCVVKSANLLIPNLAKGVKSFSFPPLDPLEVPKMDFGQSDGPVSLKLEMINTTHLGLSKMRFRSASQGGWKCRSKEAPSYVEKKCACPENGRLHYMTWCQNVDMKKNRWVLNGTIPHYSLTGKYSANGKILLVNLAGSGKSNFTFENVGIDFVIDGVPREEKSKVYMNLNKLRVHFKFSKSYIMLTNLFSGSKALGASTDEFLNQNSNEIVDALKGTLEDVYSDLYMGLLKRILSHVPYSELFKNV